MIMCLFDDLCSYLDVFVTMIRRALSLSSSQAVHPHLEQNYYDFEEQRLPGGLYEVNEDGTKGGPNVDIVKRSVVCVYSFILLLVCLSVFFFLLKE